jgi:hypothetical protein
MRDTAERLMFFLIERFFELQALSVGMVALCFFAIPDFSQIIYRIWLVIGFLLGWVFSRVRLKTIRVHTRNRCFIVANLFIPVFLVLFVSDLTNDLLIALLASTLPISLMVGGIIFSSDN